jgi:hypothetical protein
MNPYFLFGLIAFLVVVFGALVFAMTRMHNISKQSALIREKLSETADDYVIGSARIVSLHHNGHTTFASQFVITLEVQADKGDSFEISKRNPMDSTHKGNVWFIPNQLASMIKKGEVLPVRINRADPSWVFFEFEFEDDYLCYD